YGSGGAGSPHQLLAEILKSMTGIEMAHVAYKGSSPALNDVIGGHIQLLFSDPLPSLPQIKAGNVRALGVSTAARWPTAPEIPTIAESGVPGFDAAGCPSTGSGRGRDRVGPQGVIASQDFRSTVLPGALAQLDVEGARAAVTHAGLREAEHDRPQLGLLQPVRDVAAEHPALPLARQVAEPIGLLLAALAGDDQHRPEPVGVGLE